MMGYSGVFVFGDSLVDAGNALKLAKLYGTLTLSELPDGAPSSELGYHDGRFTNGYTFADLISNKTLGAVTKPIFPYRFEYEGIPISPWTGDPSGINLNFAYGGAQIRQGAEVVPDLDSQTDMFRDAVDGRADPSALYMVTMGGNDVRSLAKTGSDPVPRDQALAGLDECAQQLVHELSQLIAIGVKNILITGVPDVGLVARYDRDGNNVLDASEQLRADAATEYSQYLDMLIRTVVVPELEAKGADVTYVPIMDYTDETTGQVVTGALSANLQTLAVLNGIQPNEPGETAAQELSQNLLAYENVLFFDGLHPTAQAHALLGSSMHAQLNNLPWIENIPLLGADVDYAAAATIGAPGEVDRVSVAMVANTTYTFQMLGVSSITNYTLGQLGIESLPSGPLLGDPSLKLLSPSGVVLRADDDSGAGFDSSLAHAATAAGVYSLQLSAVGGLTGTYVLTATVTGAAMEVGNGYTVSSGSTLVLEGAGGVGIDTVSATVSYALAGGSEIELLQTTNSRGKGTINLTGNEFGQKIVGNAAANILEGKGGADEFVGGAGNDRFVLSKTAVEIRDGSQIDKISDYAKGDVVDITQILGVASGTNVIGGGFVRVTTGGLVQVDLDGGANDWVTLSTINGTGAVAVRYLSGGAATSVSVNRTDSAVKSMSTANSNTVLLGAVAASGMMSMPAAAQGPTIVDDGFFLQGGGSIAGGGTISPTAGDWSSRSALAGEIREFLDESAASLSMQAGGAGSAVRAPDASSQLAEQAAPAVMVSELSGGSDVPAKADLPAHSSLVAEAVVMPPADIAVARDAMPLVGGSQAAAEVARVLADALSGGGTNALDALLDGLPSTPQSPSAPVVSGWEPGPVGAFAFQHVDFSAEEMAIQVAALPLA